MLIHNANVTGSMHLNGMDMSSITGSLSERTFNLYSASINEFTGSADSRLDSLETTSGSLQTASGSFSTRVTSLESFSSSLDATFATDAQLSGVSESLASRLTSDESNISSLQTASGSFSTRVTDIEADYATTGSNTFTGTQNITNTTNATGFTSEAALYTDGGLRVSKDTYVSGTIYVNNLTVYGSASVEYVTSSVLVGLEYIDLNTDAPALRYAGIRVTDSGSVATYVTSSLLWDSENNKWIYTNPAGSGYSGGMLISGPRASALGEEQGTTNNALIKGQGGDHITSSLITDDGSKLRVPYTVEVTGSVTATSVYASSLTGSINGSYLDNNSVQNAKLANSSVTVTAGSGLSGGGSVSLGSSITLTNAAPDQTVTLTNGGNITITGTYPNFTLTNGITNNNQLTNGAGYITGISSGDVTTALGYTPVTNARTLTINGTAYDLSADRSWTIAAGVSSVSAGTGINVNQTTGAVTVTNTGVTSLTAGSGISVSASTGGITVTNTITNNNQLTNGAGYITGINSSMVTTALGYTPYNSTNPSGYITSAALSSYLALSGGTMTGAITTPTGTSIYIGGQNVTTSARLIINWHTDSDYNYLIGKRAGSWTQPMDIAFYTGIRYHAHQAYGGHKFYVAGYDNTESLSIGNGDNHVRVLQNFYAPIMYDYNDTTYYLDPSSTSRMVNLWLRGAGQYDGYLYVGGTSAGDRLNINFDQVWTATGNLHFQYSSAGNIDMNQGGGYTFSRTSLRAPIFYDYNDTSYYLDPASTSVMLATYIGGHYYYTYNSSNIMLRTAAGGGSSSGILLQDGSGNFRIQLYGDGSNYGFLNGNWAAWDMRKNNGGPLYLNNQSTYYYDDDVTYVYRVYGTADMRSPIYYDLDNTGYYLDPASTSNLNILAIADYQYIAGQTVNGQSHYQWEGATYRNPGTYTAGLIIRRDNSTTGLDGSYPALVLYNNNGSNQTTVAMSFATMESASGGNAVPLGGIIAKKSIAGNNGGWSSGDLTFYVKDVGTRRDGMTIYTAGYVQSDYSFRSPIFYDSNDTGYYLDPNSNSRLYQTFTNVSYFGVDSNKGYAQGYGTYSTQLHKIARITFDWDSNYNAENHGIFSTNINGSYSDNMSINSYNDINLRIDSNDNDAASYVRFHQHTTGNGQFAYVGYDGSSYVAFFSGHLYGGSSARSPIFYDYDNTGYYLDPTSTTSIRTVGSWRSDSSSWDGEFSGKIQYHSNHWYIQAADLLIYRNAGGSNVFTVNQSGVAIATGDMRAPVFYDQNDTTYYMDLNSTTSGLLRGNLRFNDYGAGVVGTYDSYKYQAVFSMGNAYLLPINGTSTGNLYGIAWSHPNAGGIAGNLADHGMLILQNGTFQGAWGGGSLRTPSDVRGTLFYDWNDTGYYANPNSMSSMWGIAIRGDNSSTGTDNQIFFWGSGNSTTSAIGFKANGGYFGNPTGNGDGYNTYLTMDTDGRGWVFRRGVGGTDFGAAYTSGWILNNGIWQANASMRSPIFYDSDNTGYYIDAASTSRTNYDVPNKVKIVGHVNNEPRWDFSCYVVEAQHWYGNNSSQTMYLGEGSNTIQIPGSGGIRPTIMYDYSNTGYYCDPASTSNLNTVTCNDWYYINGSAGMYWNSYSRGFRSPEGEGSPYGHISTYGSGRNGWSGYAIGSRHCFMSTTSDNVGVHDTARGWIWYWNGSSFNIDHGFTNIAGSARSPIFYDSNDTSYYVDPNGTSYCNRFDANQFYVYGWFRNHTNNTGLYNENTTQHWSSKDNGYWDASSTNTVSSIRFFTGGHVYNGTLRGYVYANNSNEIGFLDNGGDWTMRTDSSSNCFAHGTLYSYNDVVAYYSDERLKTKTGKIENALDKVMSLEAFTYTHNELAVSLGYDNNKEQQIGLSAQDVQKIAPELVTLAAFDVATDEEGNKYSKSGENYLTIKYDRLVPVLIEAIKEQQKQIEELKAKLG